ncbi:MAG: nitroreductase family protein [Candidatus Woesearchaeota archaeon]
MDALEAIKKRRSIRKYLSIPVEWDKLSKILEAGSLAPCAGNLQAWKFIIVLDPDKRREIAEACSQQWWMAAAPVHIIVCGEPKKVGRFYSERGEQLYIIQDCAAAAENMFIAATALELGMCWVGAFDEKMLKKAVSMPENAIPYAVLTLGYPDESPSQPAKYSIEKLTYFEKWGNTARSEAEITGEYSEYVKQALVKAKKFLEKFKR